MTEINFGSTYRIPITQAGVNSAKKAKLRELIESYPNGLIGKSKTGQARVSVPDSEDNNFVSKLKAIGYKVFQKFEGDNIAKEDIDLHIKTKLNIMDYEQKGKRPQRMSKELKAQRRFEKNYIEPKELKAAEEEDLAQTISETTTKTQPEKVKKEPIKFPKAEKTAPYNKKAEIRASKSYQSIKNEYGEDFAEAVFFGIKK